MGEGTGSCPAGQCASLHPSLLTALACLFLPLANGSSGVIVQTSFTSNPPSPRPSKSPRPKTSSDLSSTSSPAEPHRPISRSAQYSSSATSKRFSPQHPWMSSHPIRTSTSSAVRRPLKPWSRRTGDASQPRANDSSPPSLGRQAGGKRMALPEEQKIRSSEDSSYPELQLERTTRCDTISPFACLSSVRAASVFMSSKRKHVLSIQMQRERRRKGKTGRSSKEEEKT
jgi:hypothetical protein